MPSKKDPDPTQPFSASFAAGLDASFPREEGVKR